MAKKHPIARGRRYGQLIAIEFVERIARPGADEKDVRHGNTVSCGCAQKKTKLTHGHTSHRRLSREYSVWMAMRSRCYDSAHASFRNYGARGIRVCDRWRDSFENFLSDMGPRPSAGHSIDRINNDGDYEPQNCRWATIAQQRANMRRSRR